MSVPSVLVPFAFGTALIVVASFAITAQAAGGCSATASTTWLPYKGPAYRVEAFSNGQTCRNAAVTIVVRGPYGKVLWAEAAPAEHLMTFAQVRTRAQMTRALGEWLSQSQMFRSSGDLPEWKRGDDAPEGGEFPFYPEPHYDRESYEKARAAKMPMLCYVQGMESMACLGLENESQMTKIGVQLFPG